MLLDCLELQLFLITEFATFTEPEIYFFRSGKRITITKFSFFAGNPFKNKHALFGWWDQKWRETEINASSSCENKVLSLIGLRQETINCRKGGNVAITQNFKSIYSFSCWLLTVKKHLVEDQRVRCTFSKSQHLWAHNN